MNKFYITTPVYYVNSSPHIGHAYTNIISDCMARFKRFQGSDVFFLTGTDEHGEKIKKASVSQGEDVVAFVNRFSNNFKDLWERLNISHDFFIRTTDKFHTQTVQDIIVKLAEKEDIYKSKYKGYYCIPCESFWTSSQIKEINGCPDCKRAVEQVEEENYFFKLSKYQDWLIKYLESNPGFVRPKTRYNEVIAFLKKNNLEDLCISRPKKRLSWGVDFPLDKDYVVYVWFDALINYVSGIGFSTDDQRFKKLWPADIHFMAKDILRHHAIFWPIMLKALDLDLPGIIFSHGWWKFKGEKISKSRGNIVNPLDLIEIIGIDSLRYFLLREVPLGSDGNFSWEAIVNRVNSDLANDLGNLLYRTLNMAEKYFKGDISSNSREVPVEFNRHILDLKSNYVKQMENLEFSLCLENIFKFVRTMNKYIEEKKPWNLWKEKKSEELASFLYFLLEGIRVTAVYLYPFMPDATVSINSQLGVNLDKTFAESVVWGKIINFHTKKESPLFPRIDVD